MPWSLSLNEKVNLDEIKTEASPIKMQLLSFEEEAAKEKKNEGCYARGRAEREFFFFPLKRSSCVSLFFFFYIFNSTNTRVSY